MLECWPRRAAATDGIAPIGVSARSLARGGADVAMGDSPLSQFDNPATLVLSPVALDFEWGAHVLLGKGDWEAPLGKAESDVRIVPLANAAIRQRLDDRWAWGAALISKSGLASRYRQRHLFIPFMRRRVGSDVKDVALGVNLAYRATESLSLGVGLRGEVLSTEFNEVLGPFDLSFARGHTWGGGFQAGVHYQATERLALGASYRSPTWFADLKSDDMDVSLLGVILLDIGDGRLNSPTLPQCATAGLAWQATDRTLITGEVRWLGYSGTSFDTLTIEAPDLFGLRLTIPPRYRDQWIWIAGVEYALNDHWTVAAGYNYATAPVPAEHLSPIASVIAQHHITAGLRYEADGWWLGFGGMYGLEASLEGGGRSNIPFAVDFGFSDLSQTQYSVFLGGGVSF